MSSYQSWFRSVSVVCISHSFSPSACTNSCVAGPSVFTFGSVSTFKLADSFSLSSLVLSLGDVSTFHPVTGPSFCVFGSVSTFKAMLVVPTGVSRLFSGNVSTFKPVFKLLVAELTPSSCTLFSLVIVVVVSTVKLVGFGAVVISTGKSCLVIDLPFKSVHVSVEVTGKSGSCSSFSARFCCSTRHTLPSAWMYLALLWSNLSCAGPFLPYPISSDLISSLGLTSLSLQSLSNVILPTILFLVFHCTCISLATSLVSEGSLKADTMSNWGCLPWPLFTKVLHSVRNSSHLYWHFWLVGCLYVYVWWVLVVLGSHWC